MNVSVESDSVVCIILYDWIYQRKLNRIQKHFSLFIRGPDGFESRKNIKVECKWKVFSYSRIWELERQPWAGTGVMSRNRSHEPEPEPWAGTGTMTRTWSQELDLEPGAVTGAMSRGTGDMSRNRCFRPNKARPLHAAVCKLLQCQVKYKLKYKILSSEVREKKFSNV